MQVLAPHSDVAEDAQAYSPRHPKQPDRGILAQGSCVRWSCKADDAARALGGATSKVAACASRVPPPASADGIVCSWRAARRPGATPQHGARGLPARGWFVKRRGMHHVRGVRQGCLRSRRPRLSRVRTVCFACRHPTCVQLKDFTGRAPACSVPPRRPSALVTRGNGGAGDGGCGSSRCCAGRQGPAVRALARSLRMAHRAAARRMPRGRAA